MKPKTWKSILSYLALAFIVGIIAQQVFIDRGIGMEMTEVQPNIVHESYEKSGLLLVDVREVNEFVEAAVPYAKNFPLSSFDVNKVLATLDIKAGEKSPQIYLICRSGSRSKRAGKMFIDAGYKNIVNVKGGMLRWQEQGLPTRSGAQAPH